MSRETPGATESHDAGHGARSTSSPSQTGAAAKPGRMWVLWMLFFFQFAAIGIYFTFLDGPGFVLFWNSAVNLVSRLAPPSLTATAQGLFVSTTSLASIAGSLISGMLFDQLGPSGLFLVLAAFCLAAFVLYGLGIALHPQAQAIVPITGVDH